MNAVVSVCLLACALGIIVYLLSRRETTRQPSQQPLDTLYTLRLDPGRQTVVTLIFIREAFGYKEPLFPPAMLDEFMLQKLDAHRTK